LKAVGDLASADDSKIRILKDLLLERALQDLVHIRQAQNFHRTSTTLYNFRKIGDDCWRQANASKKAADGEFEQVLKHSKALGWTTDDAIKFFTDRARRCFNMEKSPKTEEKHRRMFKGKGIHMMQMAKALKNMITQWHGPPLNVFRIAAHIEAFERQAMQQQQRMMMMQKQKQLLQMQKQVLDKKQQERIMKQKQYDQIQTKMKELELAKAAASGTAKPATKFTGLKKGFLRQRRNAKASSPKQ